MASVAPGWKVPAVHPLQDLAEVLHHFRWLDRREDSRDALLAELDILHAVPDDIPVIRPTIPEEWELESVSWDILDPAVIAWLGRLPGMDGRIDGIRTVHALLSALDGAEFGLETGMLVQRVLWALSGEVEGYEPFVDLAWRVVDVDPTAMARELAGFEYFVTPE